jgi:putative SOS response-associated peptidase YedK
MCGRFSNRYTWDELHALYEISPGAPSDWKPLYNIPPTTPIPVVTSAEGSSRSLELMRWGLVPSWAKEIGRMSTHNARCEGFDEKPAYRGAWTAGRRCLIPASSYFEWRDSDKQPFAIGLGNGGPFAFAGLWDQWCGATPALRSCTIITGEPNTALAAIHDRMPVILGAEHWSIWLGEVSAAPEVLKALLLPLPSERVQFWPVGREVGNVKNERPELIDPVRALL